MRQTCWFYALVSGRCVSVNLSAISKATGRHRNTVRNEIAELLKQQVVNAPVCPFMGLYREYPLLVIVRADLPDEKRVNDWLLKTKRYSQPTGRVMPNTT